MKRAIIFANGEMDSPPAILKSLQPDDLLIAADGGSRHCKTLGITPHIIVGDLDSLDEDDVVAYREKGVEILQHPAQKDETDLELALRLAAQRSISEVFIFGALGRRWDMTFANILLMALPAFSGLKIHIHAGRQEMFLLQGQQYVDLDGRRGETLSLIPLAGDALNITTQGLEYQLTDETLYFGSSRGVSNVFTGNHAHIELARGTLLCILSEGDSN